jgi:hypothetical protein
LEQQYQLTPAQVDELNENPGQAVPKLLARVHYSAQVAAYTGVMSQVPRVVQAIVERHRMIEKAEGTFYGRWPALANASHSKAVENVLNTWRAANPNATTEEMVEKAGLMAMLSLGLDPTPQASIPPPGNPTPPTPPARPAGTGGSGPTRGATNVWDEMAESIIAEGT